MDSPPDVLFLVCAYLIKEVWVDGPGRVRTERKRHAVWATINYAISTGRLERRKEEVEVGPTQRPDESDGSEVSDINDRA